MSKLRFQRANYVVQNIERSLVLYRDILGFEVAFIKESPEDSYSYPVFEIDSSIKMQFAVLSTEDQPRVMALTEVPDANRAPQPFPRRAAIVLETPRIDEIIAGCKKEGLHVYPEERLETHDGRIGRELGIVDLDGNLVVLYYIPKTS